MIDYDLGLKIISTSKPSKASIIAIYYNHLR